MTEKVKDERPRHFTSLKPGGSADTDGEGEAVSDADRLRVTDTDLE